MRFRVEQVLFAVGLALAGLSFGALRALQNPNSRLSRAVDGATTMPPLEVVR